MPLKRLPPGGVTESSFDEISSLELAIADNTYSEVLSVLGNAVKVAADRADSVRKSRGPDIADMVPEMQGDIIGNLLGAAYLVCQSKITAVVQAALKEECQIAKERPGFSVFGTDFKMRKLGEPFDCSNYSKLQVLWELGNYFKHGDEWNLVWDGMNSDWDIIKKKNKRTITAIKAAGLSPMADRGGNLFMGAKALGNTEYSNMTVFTKIIADWSECVRKRFWLSYNVPEYLIGVETC